MSTERGQVIYSAEEQLEREQLASIKVIETAKLLGHGGTIAGTDLTISDLTAKLFARAPYKMIEAKSSAQLADIVNATVATLEQITTGKKSICVSTLEAPAPALLIALEDRPFTVNTILNQLTGMGAKIVATCHPIIAIGSRSFLVSYIELAASVSNNSQLDKFASRLLASLEAVVLAVSAFPSIQKLVEHWTQEFESATSKTGKALNSEVAELLRWFKKEAFIFIGAAEWENGSAVAGSEIGLLNPSSSLAKSFIAECKSDIKDALKHDEPFYLAKLSIESPVQRPVRLTHAIFRSPSNNRLLSVIGIFTSKAMVEESSAIPLLRTKLADLLVLADAPIHSHDHKVLSKLFNSLPKHELFGRSSKMLYEILYPALTLDQGDAAYISVTADASGRGLSVLAIMSKERFNLEVRERMRSHLAKVFGTLPRSGDHQFGLTNQSYGRVTFFVPLPQASPAQVDFSKLERELLDLTMMWKDAVKNKLMSDSAIKDAASIWGKYCDGFNDSYQTQTAAEEAVHDLKICETISEKNPIEVRLGATNGNEPRAITVYSFGKNIPISQALPILENIGLFVTEERTSSIIAKGGATNFVHRFFAAPEGFGKLSQETFNGVVRPGLKDLLTGTMENDPLNRLLMVDLDCGAIKLLRLYLALYWQVNRTSSKKTNIDALAALPELTKQLWQVFDTKFNPALKLSVAERKTKAAAILAEIAQALRQKADPIKDKIFKGVIQLLEHTVRTNYYIKASALAIKLQSELIQIMPEPKPKFEVFVSNSEMEGVHLRSDMVARGGLRWSERPDDYRVEVLGLMKTQRIKNSLIVPKGAKGGFIVKTLPKEPSAFPGAVVATYKTFIRSLLSICDNIVDNKVKHPEGVVIHDMEDPYFVVAADKGTATFSDIANEIAVSEFNFWLGDAFASGGSRGYSHKDYAITARGAWECTKRHFCDLGIDFVNKPFTVVGIGDMSGDVFGNGLLQSQQMCLLAAFDHRNIFLDPSPDAAKSFVERKRLFQLARSSWADYSKELISKGGGVFGRFDREIPLSSEIRAALDIPENTPKSVSGDQLVSLIIGAKVDLLWNGGIGTFFKATTEAHSDANDSSNDLIRLNADEIRVRVIAEGGNLGMTQKARIEANQRGIRLNTDAIDNSAGVDLSDHEVNLKILLARAIADGKLTLKERDEILLRNVKLVCDSVLEHNYSQALALTIATRRTPRHMDYYRALIREVNDQGYINRALEKLPSNEEISERLRKGHNLTRPELAVLISGGKMMLKDVVLKSKLIEDPSLKGLLTGYFPQEIREKFAAQIPGHRLAPHIIATQVVNELLHVTGISYMHRLATTYGLPIETVLKCTLAAYFILDIPTVFGEVKKFDEVKNNEKFLDLVRDIIQVVERTATWLIANHGIELQLHEMIKLYAEPLKSALSTAEGLPTAEKNAYVANVQKLATFGLSTATAQKISLAPVARKLLEVLAISIRTKSGLAAVTQTFGTVSKLIGSNEILAHDEQLEIKNKWENELVVHAQNQVRRCVATLCVQLISDKVSASEAIQERVSKLRGYERLVVLLDEIRGQVPSPAALSVIAKQLQLLVPGN
jgi:glutamate dehydrogenase